MTDSGVFGGEFAGPRDRLAAPHPQLQRGSALGSGAGFGSRCGTRAKISSGSTSPVLFPEGSLGAQLRNLDLDGKYLPRSGGA